jgi:DNA-binding MarR family transcriptional regulator
MSAKQTARAGASVSPEVIGLEGAVSRMAYLLTRTRRHEWMKAASGVPLDRAAMAVLRQLDESGATRPGELAALLQVEAPHVTRQVQLLERSGYATRVADPDDRRARLIGLTASGRAAANRVREASRMAVQAALAHWSPRELDTLGTLLRRLVDDFMANAAEEGSEDNEREQ